MQELARLTEAIPEEAQRLAQWAWSLLVGGGVHGESAGALPWTVLALGTLLAALVGDFAYYVTHRLHHEHPVLWPFHKLHHNAEYLTPLTAKRNHPV